MRIFFVIPLALVASMEARAEVSFDCGKEVDKAMEDCDNSATSAFMTNNASAREAARSIAGANGLMENAGAMQSDVAMRGMRTIDGATTECKQQKEKMRRLCAQASREAQAKNHPGTLEQIKDNLKEGERYIDNRTGNLDSEIANLAGNGVAGGQGVISQSSASP